MFYITLLGVGFIAAYLLIKRLRGPGDEGTPADRDLDPYAMAFLAGGGKRAADTVIAHLVERGDLVYDAQAKRLLRGERAHTSRFWHPLELAIHDSLPEDGRSIGSVHQQAMVVAEELFAKELIRKRLLLSSDERLRLKRIPSYLLGAIIIIGLVKLDLAQSWNRPTGYLKVLLVVGTVGSILFVKRMTRDTRTLRGKRVVKTLCRQNAALVTTARAQAASGLPEKESLLLMGLFGLSVVTLPALAELQHSLLHLAAPLMSGGGWTSGGGGPYWYGGGGGGSSCSGSGGSSCGGGGGSSCGGGGGCGGCGGGG
ncbi:MAG TPA: TIGR04222 domain-containing membrane protein [Archangium sp.]|uniref:TIGR04222 domain-containing membrane protein n=1 Tax=Archangium sp. TaxID=1872627 RepID=UPI002E2F32DA|nr:TIGR04222 domain-containing membrane protein [Archangium sp.]HEX5752498.1 TIGR04222 domain-containing membrane protein [Archangium sp.]